MSASEPLAGAGVRLREMSWRDIPHLAVLDAELFGPDGWSEATWWSELAGRPRRDYVVAVAADRGGTRTSAGGTAYQEVTGKQPALGDGGPGEPVAGYAGLDHGGEVADVMTLAVVPARRGSGVGDLLVAELVRRARQRGAQALLLEVRADNEAAIRLYRRHGLEQVRVRPRYYQPGDVDALVMRLRLGTT